MSSQKDVQDLLRLLTTGRNKLTMLAAMGRVKALQGASLGSISAIAEADLPAIEKALGDPKAAKQLHTAAKSSLKDGSGPSKKRATESPSASAAKRKRLPYELDEEPQGPEALEALYTLPDAVYDEEELKDVILHTNRAPLVLAFAVTLLKYTMPEQPPSSRLSLAQAVVSMNSQSKAQSIGITSGATAEQEGWGLGQPKVRIMGREIYVLKRGGYEWKPPGAEKVEKDYVKTEDAEVVGQGEETSTSHGAGETAAPDTDGLAPSTQWHTSQPITTRKSTFIARSITITSPAHARSLIANLPKTHPSIVSATHNVTAWRSRLANGTVVEASDSDGETGAGAHVLQLLHSTNTVDVLIVLSRWFGGIMLGPDRWRLMTSVVNEALSARQRITGVLDAKEALWGLDLDEQRSRKAPVAGGVGAGMAVHQPASAREYLLKSFGMAEKEGVETKKKTTAALKEEKEKNLGLLLGALELLFDSWMPYLARDELDRRAWSWYVNVRPSVEGGIRGWGAKGDLKLADILRLRRKEDVIVKAETAS